MQEDAVYDECRRRRGMLRIEVEWPVMREIKSLRRVQAGAAGANGSSSNRRNES